MSQRQTASVMRKFSFSAFFSKQKWHKVLLSWFFVVKKHEMWSFSIKFGELRYKNVNNTFMIKREFALKISQSHTRLASLESNSKILNKNVQITFSEIRATNSMISIKNYKVINPKTSVPRQRIFYEVNL